MAAQIHETHESRSRDNTSVTLNYFIWGETDDSVVWTLLYATAPTTWLGYFNPTATLDPIGAGAWKGAVTYSLDGAPEPATEPGPTDALTSEDGISFDIAPAKFKIFQSFETVDAIALTGIPPLFNRAINVNKGKVEGVELGDAPFTFTLTRTRPVTTLAYIDYLSEIQFCTNREPFYGCAAGEALFLGASGSAKAGKPYVIQYKFGRGKHKSYFEVADGLSFPQKRAWDYVWCLYAEDVDEDVLIKTPVAAYIEGVYESADFNLLGL